MIKKLGLAVALTVPITAHAGFEFWTHHSRANCYGINETITWFYGHFGKYQVEGDHILNGTSHNVKTQPENTWRHGAVHWSEAPYGGKWIVAGKHWAYSFDWKMRWLEHSEIVNNCSIYDGWYDV